MKEFLYLLLLMALSLTFGILYSIYNTDPHHWGFILGSTLDYIHGKSLFSEIYIQYGMGEPILFNLLHHFIPIHYTSIGIITAFIYSCNLFVLYLSFKSITSQTYALLILSAVFLLHSYSIYPWPDYFAGFCLSIACYLMVKKEEQRTMLRFCLAGAFLFCATLFRSTYLVSIALSGFAYLALAVMFKNIRNKNLMLCLSVFGVLSIFFILTLYSQNTLSLWYAQAVGAASSQYGVGMQSIVLLLKRAFFPAKFWLPNNLVYTSFTVLFYLSIYASFRFLFRKGDGLFLFLGLMGLAGILQASLGYEAFRLQNSCSPLFLVLASMNIPLQKKKILVALAAYFILMLAKFPNASSLFPIRDGEANSFSNTDIPLFRWHQFQAEEKNYYETIHQHLCDGKSMILNRTMDATIPYLCEGQSNALALPFFNPSMLATINAKQVQDDQTGNYQENQIIFSDTPLITNPKVKLTPLVSVIYPHKFRYFGQTQASVYRVEKVE